MNKIKSLLSFIFGFCPSAIEASLFAAFFTFVVVVAPAQQYPDNPIKGTTPMALQNAAANPNGIDNVNLFSGRLSVSIPLRTVTGRGEAEYTMRYNIQSLPWFKVIDFFNPEDPNGYLWWNHPGEGLYSGGPGYLPVGISGRTTAEDSSAECTVDFAHWRLWLTRLYVGLPDGSQIELRDVNSDGQRYWGYCWQQYGANRGTTFASNDGSGYTFVSDTAIVDDNQNLSTIPDYPPFILPPLSGYLYQKTGLKYRIEQGRLKWMLDRNGNKINFNQSPSQYDPLTITDSIGRQITTFDNFSHQINYKGFDGAQKEIQVSNATLGNSLRSGYQLMSEQNLEISNSSTLWDTQVTNAITLPDGRHFQFKYDPRANLARIELPTGGAYEYDQSFTTLGGGPVYCPPTNIIRVNEKRVYDAQGTLESKTTFSADYGAQTVITVNHFDSGNHLLSTEKHYFQGTPVNAGCIHSTEYAYWKDGKELKTEFFASDGTTLLRKIELNWQQRATQSANAEKDPRIIETTTTLVDTGQVSKTSAISPIDGSIGFDQYNNPTDIWQYDFGSGSTGALLKRTHIDYVTGSAYINAYLRTLPSQTWVSSDAWGSNKASLAQFEYDTHSGGTHAPLVDRANVVGHDPSYNQAFTTRGNVTAITSFADAQNQTGAITTYSQYDILGNVVKTYDPKDNISIVDYDDNFGVPDNAINSSADQTRATEISQLLNGYSTFAFPTSSSNPLSWNAYTQYDYYIGESVNTKDINNLISKTVYNDPLDRVTQTVNAITTLNETQTTFSYDDLTTHKITTTSDLNALNDNLVKSESYFDGLGRTVETRRYESNGSYVGTKYVPFTSIQDPETGVWRAAGKVSNPYRSNSGEQFIWTSSLSDSLGRGTKVITSDGSKIKTAFDGNRTLITDQAGKQIIKRVNALGQIKEVWEITAQDQWTESVTFPGSSIVTGYKTSYDYDAFNNLTSVNQGSQTRTFTYDTLSRLLSASNPESGTVSLTYDPNGNVKTKRDGRGIKIVYDYDNLNRMMARCYRSIGTSGPLGMTTCVSNNETPAPNSHDATYTFENTNISSLKGVLTQATNGFSTTDNLEFDATGRITKSRQTTDGTVYNPMFYTYNLSGILVEETYPSGRIVKNSFDNNGNLTMVRSKEAASNGFVTYASSFTYNAVGEATSIHLGNGKWESTQFNSRLQPEQIALGTVQNGTDILKLNYSYGMTNNNGNLQSQTITVPAVGQSQGFVAFQTYTYDSLNRIQTAEERPQNFTQAQCDQNPTQCWKQTFSFDRYGNRRFDTANNATTTLAPNCPTVVCNPQIDQAKNQLTGYGFDSTGNTTADAENRSFIYDAENNQVEVRDSSISPPPNDPDANLIGRYSYDAEGNRVKKLVRGTGEITIFIHDTTGKLLEEYSTVVESPQNAKVSYLTNDQLGSPRINTDQNGNTVARHDYHPYGEEIAGIGGRIAGVGYNSDSVRKKFTSYERDTEINMDYAKARYHNFELGRFQSPDPIFISQNKVVNPQLWNRYSYVGNNPLKYVDPLGLDRIPLGETEEELKKRREEEKSRKEALKKEKDELKKNKASKEEIAAKQQAIDASNKKLDLIDKQIEATRVVTQILDILGKAGKLNGLQLKDFVLSTDTKKDFAGHRELDKILSSQAFYNPNDKLIYILGGRPRGFYSLYNSTPGLERSDWLYYGATVIGHEDWHKHNGASENGAYRYERTILILFKDNYRNPSLYQQTLTENEDAIKNHPQ
jgi:RHS repeat-associated protein